MTTLELIIDFHRNAERQGPGSPKDTLRALELVDLPKNKAAAVADIGCGSGGQTITLAQHINGHLTAVDLFPEFLEELELKAKKRDVLDQISTLKASMDNLPFDKDSFDLIWSEGAIYNIGFEKGIRQWKDFLKAGGDLAVSEVTWITNSRPKEIEDFWNREYPEIDVASNKIKILEENGYSLTGYFYLAQDSWTENYYKPMESRFEAFLQRHHHSETAEKVVQEHRKEIELYHRYKEYYSYGFYVARRNAETISL